MAIKVLNTQVPPIFVYINYPNPHFMIHREECRHVPKHENDVHRYIRINDNSFKSVLKKILNGECSFASEAKLNDVWIEIDLDNNKLNEGLVYVIQKILGQQSFPLAAASVNKCEHCHS